MSKSLCIFRDLSLTHFSFFFWFFIFLSLYPSLTRSCYFVFLSFLFSFITISSFKNCHFCLLYVILSYFFKLSFFMSVCMSLSLSLSVCLYLFLSLKFHLRKSWGGKFFQTFSLYNLLLLLHTHKYFSNKGIIFLGLIPRLGFFSF